MNNILNDCEKEEKGRTIKSMLEELDLIQTEIEYQVDLIADAVYRGLSPKVQTVNDEPINTPPMAVIIENHVLHSKALLEELIKIKEALW